MDVKVTDLGPCSMKNTRYNLQCGDCSTTFPPNELRKVRKENSMGTKEILMCLECLSMYEVD